jgi:hypothetical protein
MNYWTPEQRDLYFTPDSIATPQQMEEVRRRQVQQLYARHHQLQHQQRMARQNDRLALYNQQLAQHHLASVLPTPSFPLPHDFPLYNGHSLGTTAGGKMANKITPSALQHSTGDIGGNVYYPTVWGPGMVSGLQGLSALPRESTMSSNQAQMDSRNKMYQLGALSMGPTVSKVADEPAFQARKKRKASDGNARPVDDVKELANSPTTTAAAEAPQSQNLQSALSFDERQFGLQTHGLTAEQVQKLATEGVRSRRQSMQDVAKRGVVGSSIGGPLPKGQVQLQEEEDRLREQFAMINQQAQAIHVRLGQIDRLKRDLGWVNNSSRSHMACGAGQSQVGQAHLVWTQPAAHSRPNSALTAQGQQREDTPDNRGTNIDSQGGHYQSTDILNIQIGSGAADNDVRKEHAEEEAAEYLDFGTTQNEIEHEVEEE